jgi:hypothetical protein
MILRPFQGGQALIQHRHEKPAQLIGADVIASARVIF